MYVLLCSVFVTVKKLGSRVIAVGLRIWLGLVVCVGLHKNCYYHCCSNMHQWWL
jgi:hypothetical protein